MKSSVFKYLVRVFCLFIFVVGKAFCMPHESFRLDKDIYCIYKTVDVHSSKDIRYNCIIQDSNTIMNSNDSLIFQSPIWIDDISKTRIAMNHKIILYDVSNISSLLTAYNLSENILSIDTIEGEPIIYVISLHSLGYQEIDSICILLNNSIYCQIAEPDYMIFTPIEDITPEQNLLFDKQWQLYDSIYTAHDVNAKEAWNYSTGTDVKVAIIDNGFELEHPDLKDNFLQGYDCTDGADGAKYGAYKENIDSHGTQCAGIIGAVDNNIGTIGISPHSQMIPIRHAYSSFIKKYGVNIDTLYNNSIEYTIKAFRTAYLNGADVISNSWSLRDSISTIYDAILTETTTFGREGLGCVVVFSVGNYNLPYVHYPNNRSDVISVGASTRYGERADFSNYGKGLDVVAPGDRVQTTQIIPYDTFCISSGTSMACPMVAGIAALILSQNPYLTWEEVHSIIKSTAYKLSGYTYNVETQDGTWNEKVGHGLVDAYAAIIEASKAYIQNVRYSSEDIEKELGSYVYIGDSVTNRKAHGDVIVNDGSNLLVQATKEIRFTNGFHAKAGSNIIAQIVPESEWKNLESARNLHTRSYAPNRNNQLNDENDTKVSAKVITNNSVEYAENEVIISTTIYTISGQLIQTISGDQHDAVQLPNGMYVLQHRMSDGSVRSEKLANYGSYK